MCRRFTLVPTAMLLADPEFACRLSRSKAPRRGGMALEDHLSAIIQEDSTRRQVEQVLAHLAWPEVVLGAALTASIVVPRGRG